MNESKDRHRPGYYQDYAERTGRKDRHRPGYYEDYYSKKEVDDRVKDVKLNGCSCSLISDVVNIVSDKSDSEYDDWYWDDDDED